MKQPYLLLANGPNLGLLGLRQPHIYGYENISQVQSRVSQICENHSVICVPFQSDAEGELISWLGQWYCKFVKHEISIVGIVINAAGLSHTSVVLADALSLFTESEVALVEVHISNIYRREKFRHHSYISRHACAVVSGLGVYGYTAATEYLINRYLKGI